MTRVEERSLKERAEYLPAAVGVCVFIVVLGRCAWLCDDAFITFRTVENFVNGYGLRWNVAERVQSYSHPLWMFVLTAAYWITREFYYTSIMLCSVLSIAAVVYSISRIAVGPLAALLGMALFTCSKAFVDFSVSGLENPLSHLLLAWFTFTYLLPDDRPRRLFVLSLIAALVVLNRMDLLLIVAPAVAAAFWKRRGWNSFGAVLLGFSPFILWALFALFYYGSPFPNTAFAKLNHDIGHYELICRGLKYLLATLTLDPLTLVIIAAGIIVPFFTSQRRLLPLSLGSALYIAYILHIGGDFMLGRFLAAPFLVSVLLLINCPMSKQTGWAFILFTLIVGLGMPRSPVLSDENYGLNLHRVEGDGICDERGYYYHATGLLRVPIRRAVVRYTFADQGRLARERGQDVVIHKAVGMYGYFAGPNVYVVDEGALADPLLARLKPALPEQWRPGHFFREIPEGYIDTLKTGVNQIADPGLAAFYDKIRLITRGELWSAERLSAVIDLNLGKFDYLLDAEASKPASFDAASKPTTNSMLCNINSTIAG